MLEVARRELWTVVGQHAIGQPVRISPVRKEGVGDDLGRRGLKWDRVYELRKVIRAREYVLVTRSGLR